MKPEDLLRITPVYKGEVEVQEIEVKTEDTTTVLSRTYRKPRVAIFCHDKVNGKVLLTSTYHKGALEYLLDTPQDYIDSLESPSEAAMRLVEQQFNKIPKSITQLHKLLPDSDVNHAPLYLYYVEIDTRFMKEIPSVIPQDSKKLIREMEMNKHTSVPLVLGAQYLKLLNNKLYY